MILKVQHLEMVEAIHQAGTVTGAAKRLHITQPALSHRLAQLEGRLGVELFRREARCMVITPEGTRLLEASGRVLRELERAEYDVAQLKEGKQGLLRLSTQCYTCYHWLPRLLKRLHEAYPGVDIQIVPEATYRTEDALRDGELDIALMYRPPPSRGVTVRELFSDELVAVVPPGHPWAERAFVTAEDFTDEVVLIHTGLEESALFREVLQPGGVRPAKVLELQLTEAVVESVKAELGVSVLARWTVGRELDTGALHAARVTPTGLHRQWYAAVPSNRKHLPAIEAFVELLAEEGLRTAQACAAPVPGA